MTAPAVPFDPAEQGRLIGRRIADLVNAEDQWSAVESYAISIPNAATARLVEYWVHGKGAAKVKWGVSGSMKRCIRHLRDKVRDPGGLCAELHRAATGEWPTEHGEAGIPS
jgi:hypothetical protein